MTNDPFKPAGVQLFTPARGAGPTHRYLQIAILLILLLAAFVRFYHLPTLPPGLNFDEAGNGVAALDVLHGDFKIWWRIGGGKEPLWPYLIAASTALLGRVPLALRWPAALTGVLTVAAVYPLARVLFPRRRELALWAMLGLALSEWPLHFSRLGFRAVLLPLLSALAIYFLWRSFIQHRKGAWLAAVFLAAAVYAYLAGRMLPLAVAGFAALLWLADWRQRTVRRWTPLLRLALAFFVLLLPLIIYFARYPADFSARAGTVSIFNPVWNQGDLTGTAGRVLALSLGTFAGLTGDANPLVNLPGQPAVSLLLAPFLLVGLGLSLWRAVRLFTPAGRTKNPTYLLLIVWGSVMLLPALLAPEGAPHHLRLLGAMIPAYLLVALGLVTVADGLARWLAGRPARLPVVARFVLPAVLFAAVGWQTGQNYFVRWPQTDFTLPFDLYATRLAADIARADARAGYVLPMDIRAGAEARHYTLDYLLADTPAAYTYLPVGDDAGAILSRAAAGKDQLKVVRWTADKHREADAKEIVTFLLAQAGRLTGQESFPVYNIETYALRPGATFVLPQPNRPIGANFDNLLQLDAVYLPPAAAPGGWLPLAMTLSPLAKMDTDTKASVRLVSPAGERLAQIDRTLLHNFHQGTSLWPPEPVTEYYLLPVPPDAAPGDYAVTVVFYRPDTLAPLVAAGQAEVALGTVRVD
ncbi:MAG: hypothetical protein FOGNACKC_00713 [Anaerolineae bacterium]|nr:hypothetical protein [Anaerolineae bacterium]